MGFPPVLGITSSYLPPPLGGIGASLIVDSKTLTGREHGPLKARGNFEQVTPIDAHENAYLLHSPFNFRVNRGAWMRIAEISEIRRSSSEASSTTAR